MHGLFSAWPRCMECWYRCPCIALVSFAAWLVLWRTWACKKRRPLEPTS